ncbi:MAG: VWA domain-containing protein [Acidobacteria bacterium]|nr:VWA domain-containing protein [Acidobacteriota bacterium]
MRRGVATAFVVILGILPGAAASLPEPAPRDTALAAAIERATREEKPIVLYARPAVCRKPKKGPDPCRELEEAVKHPAVRRRLERVVYLKVDTTEPVASVSVLDPGGTPVVRWALPPDQSMFRHMLTLVDGAAPNIVGAYRARSSGEATRAAREECLATLALGDETLGRGRLLGLRASDDVETRELATIWLGRFDARTNSSDLDERELEALAQKGATNRVRFEAWMSIGERRLAALENDEAIGAFRAALEVAPDAGPEHDAVAAALARSAEAASPVIGLGPAGSIVAGLRTVQPKWNEPRASRVEYKVDGRLVATAKQSPFAAAVKFDRIPTRRLLELSAIDKNGSAIRAASVVVNDRTGIFAIQIVEPAGETLSGAAAVDLSVRTPRGRSVESVIVEWNGSVVARLEAPPWKSNLEVDGGSLGVLRVVVRLDDGQEREDVRIFNTGDMLLGAGVHLVEVPVYATNRKLATGDVVVMEAGVARPVDRVIAASDAPLDVALLLDMSTSMREHVLDLEEAAIQFVGKSLEQRARVTVVAFDTNARVALWPTSDRAAIEHAIQNLRVRGATALHDAMITAILQLQAGGSRRAIVVLSDGVDNASDFAMSDVLEVAKRNAVPVYVVTLNPVFQAPPGRGVMPEIPVEAKAQRELARLARSSGGMAFDLESVKRAGSIWEKIADDLRNQSLVIYRTGEGKAGWRELDISLMKGGRLRAPEGIFIEGGGTVNEGAK